MNQIITILNNDDILIQFFNAKEFTSFHELEIMQLTFGKSTAKLMSLAIDFPPIKYEPYLYKLNHDLDTFENKVDRYLALQDLINKNIIIVLLVVLIMGLWKLKKI